MQQREAMAARQSMRARKRRGQARHRALVPVIVAHAADGSASIVVSGRLAAPRLDLHPAFQTTGVLR